MMRTQPYSRETTDPIYAQAMDLIDQEWLETGESLEALEQSAELAHVLDCLLGSGHPKEEINAAWNAEYPHATALWLRLLTLAQQALPPDDPTIGRILSRLTQQSHLPAGNLSVLQSYQNPPVSLSESRPTESVGEPV